MFTFFKDYFQIREKAPKSISRIWWASCRSSITTKNICSPMQCFFCELVRSSNFGRLKSANGHLLNRLFPNMWQIPKLHLAYIVGIIQELYHHRNLLLSTAVLFLLIGANANFCRLRSANEHILDRLLPNLGQIRNLHHAYMVGIM